MEKKYLPACMIAAAVLFLAIIYNFNLDRRDSSFAGNFSIKLDIHDSSPKSLFIQDDGTISFTEGAATEHAKISKAELESLRQVVMENNFISLDEKYKGTECCDAVAHSITITVGSKQHSVYCYNQCPEAFENVQDKIKSLWPYKIEYYGFA